MGILKESPRYRVLAASLEDLKVEAARTPTGIFINRRKPQLIFVGSVLTIGGAFAQYNFRTNDRIAGLYAAAVSSTAKVKIGDFRFGAGLPGLFRHKGRPSSVLTASTTPM